MGIFESTLSWQVILFRIGLAFILSMIIGLEREWHKQVAGLRTHILICVGSALLMILSIYVPQTYAFGNGVADPARIAAQVVSGIGFLGAGAILRYGFNVKGLTTAANIWVMAALGLTIGAGLYSAGFIAFGVILITLIAISTLEKKLFPRRHMKVIEIEFNDNLIDFSKIKEIAKKSMKINHYTIEKTDINLSKIKFISHIKQDLINNFFKDMKHKGILRFKIHDKI